MTADATPGAPGAPGAAAPHDCNGDPGRLSCQGIYHADPVGDCTRTDTHRWNKAKGCHAEQTPDVPDDPDAVAIPHPLPNGVAGEPVARVIHDLDELALFLGGSSDPFTGELLRLMCKADPHNRRRLALGFPHADLALILWHTMPPLTWGQLRHLMDRAS